MLATWTDDQLMKLVLDEKQGQVLRQCSPLGPLLTSRERWEILEHTNQSLVKT